MQLYDAAIEVMKLFPYTEYGHSQQNGRSSFDLQLQL